MGQLWQYCAKNWIPLVVKGFIIPLVLAIIYYLVGVREEIFNWIHTHYIWSAFTLSWVTIGWYIRQWAKKYLEKRKTEFNTLRDELTDMKGELDYIQIIKEFEDYRGKINGLYNGVKMDREEIEQLKNSLNLLKSQINRFNERLERLEPEISEPTNTSLREP